MRTISSLFVASVLAIVGCSSSSTPSSPSSASSGNGSGASESGQVPGGGAVAGVYQASAPGAIAWIIFQPPDQAVVATTGDGGVVNASAGTYAFGSDGDSMTFTNGAGVASTVPFAVSQLQAGVSSQVHPLGPGLGLVSGSGTGLVDAGGTLVNPVGDVVSGMNVDGTPLVLVSGGGFSTVPGGFCKPSVSPTSSNCNAVNAGAGGCPPGTYYCFNYFGGGV